jgi:peptidoglycan/LPS O-acetylase OafA/YrhL
VRGRFRPDIEGLRAIAVVAVVLYHAHVTQLSGGFAGVDVFFVVSGYLITGLLWRELREKRRISLSGFYSRRARRLLPASMLVVVVTALASRAWLPPLEVPSALKDGLASALYVGNYRFVAEHTNYLNASAPPSPFQHFWSLGVEEQFYLVWPLLLIGAAVVWRKQHAHSRRLVPSRLGAVGVLGALTIGSFGLSVWLTSTDQPWAFFSLPTRAWELGVGGLLALAGPELRRIAPRPAAVLGWMGLTGVVASMFVIGSHTPFPGWAALAPVTGAGAVLASGQALREDGLGRLGRRTGPSLVLAPRPVQFVGRISYSWYLWHWPFLILAPYVVGHSLSLVQNLAAAELSGVAAFLSYHFVENPARSSAWLARLPRRSLLSGATLSTSAGAACLIVNLTVPALTSQTVAPIAVLQANASVTTVQPTATTLDPLHAQAASLTVQLSAEVSSSVGTQEVPSNLSPPRGGEGRRT